MKKILLAALLCASFSASADESWIRNNELINQHQSSVVMKVPGQYVIGQTGYTGRIESKGQDAFSDFRAKIPSRHPADQGDGQKAISDCETHRECK